MIALLRGKLVEKSPGMALIDCAGVGYEAIIPVSAFSALPEPGHEATLHIHTHVREDALQLFGFASRDEKALFEKLISVSGIGPKLAVTALSGMAPADLVQALQTGDVPRLTRIPGIGKKTAERMVLELKDKLDLLAAAGGPAKAAVRISLPPLDADVLSALLNLGAAKPAAEAAITKARKALGDDAQFEPLFRKALEQLR